MTTLTQYVTDQTILTAALSEPGTGITGVPQSLTSTTHFGRTPEAAGTGYAGAAAFTELWWLVTAFQQRITNQAGLTVALTNAKTGIGRAATLLTTARGNI